jgi:uncharacterized protein (TIGR02246 family)
MKTHLALAAAYLALQVVAPPAHAQESQGALAKSLQPHSAEMRQRAEIEQLLGEYERALNTSDVQAAVQLYTDDGVLMAPGNPAAVGSQALQQAYAGIFQAIALNIKFQIAETQLLSHEWALLRTTSTGVIKILANGAEIPEGNQELFLLRKDDGQWKIARYSFSSFLPPAN